MCILVTGGAGFIGANFVVDWLKNIDEVVINLDKLTYAGSLQNLVSVEQDSRHVFIKGDIGDKDLVARLLKEHQPRAVVNFAAESHVDRSINSPENFIQTNIVSTFHLLDIVRDYWYGLPDTKKTNFRFLHTSTDEVYGSLDLGAPAFTETHRYEPNSPYSASKASSDYLVRAYHHTYGLPVLITRSSNNYGPLQYPEKIIPLFITNLLEGRPIPVYGDGGNVRDWCHVDDNCDAIDLVLRTGEPGTIYNVGAGNELTNLELVDRLLGLCDADPSLVEMVEDRPGHDRRYSVDAGRIRALGWTPDRDLDEGLAATVDWYRDNRWWWEPLRDNPLGR